MMAEPKYSELEEYLDALKALRLDQNRKDLWEVVSGICLSLATDIHTVESRMRRCGILDARAREIQGKVDAGDITDETMLDAVKLLFPKGPLAPLVGMVAFTTLYGLDTFLTGFRVILDKMDEMSSQKHVTLAQNRSSTQN